MKLFVKISCVVFFLIAVGASLFFWRENQEIQDATKGHAKSTPATSFSPKPPIYAVKPQAVVPSKNISKTEPLESSAASEAASTTAQCRQVLDLEVPVGAKVPAALMDAGGKDDGPEIREVLDAITNEFIAAIEHSRQAGRDPEVAWDEALRVADEKYKLFFGQEAYNEATMEAAVEGIEEKEALTPTR